MKDENGLYRIRRSWNWVKDRPIDLAIVNAMAFDYYLRKRIKPETTNLYEIEGFIEA